MEALDSDFDGEVLRRMLILHEGSRAAPYRCTGGRWTIGVGRNFQDWPFDAVERRYLNLNSRRLVDQVAALRAHPLTQTQINWLLDRTLAPVLLSVAESKRLMYTFARLDPVRRLVMLDMTFNLGTAGFRKFVRFLAALAEHRFEDAAYAMRHSRWYDQVGTRSRRLEQMILTGEIPSEFRTD